MALGLGMTLAHKATLVWASEMFDAAKTMEAAYSYKCTVLVAAATEIPSLAENKFFPSAIKKLVVLASPSNIPNTELLSKYLSLSFTLLLID